jgi:hypothetical protein
MQKTLRSFNLGKLHFKIFMQPFFNSLWSIMKNCIGKLHNVLKIISCRSLNCISNVCIL